MIDFKTLIQEMKKDSIPLSEGLRELKKQFILDALREANGNQCRAAGQLKMHRNTLSRQIRQLEINPAETRRRNVPRKPPLSTQTSKSVSKTG